MATLDSQNGPPTLLTRRGDGFVAIGVDTIWTSPDGIAWHVAATTGIDGVVVDFVERSDGSLLAFGYADGEPIDALLTWSSPDGVTWREADAGLPQSSVFVDIARGDLGYLLAAHALSNDGGPNPYQLWYSPDAVSWELVRDSEVVDEAISAVGAGPQGFVAVGQQGWQSNDFRAFVVASSDGRNWIDAPADDGILSEVGSLWTIAPLGGDWLTAPLTVGTEMPVLWSANGLEWKRLTSMPIERSDVGAMLSFFSDGLRIYSDLVDGGGRPLGRSVLWTSVDAVDWTESPIPRAEHQLGFATTNGVTVFLVDGTVYVHRE